MFTHRNKQMELAGFVPDQHATTAEMRQCESDWDDMLEGHAEAQAELETERRYELWLEGGGAAGERIAAEHQQDLALAAEFEDPNACRGGVCRSILEQCDRHSQEYQNRYGRAANE